MVAVLIGIAAIVFWRLNRSGEDQSSKKANLLDPAKRPSAPPTGRKRTAPRPMPKKPHLSQEFFASKYKEAVDRGDKRPGAAAFRAGTDAFFDHNIEFGKAKAAKEGITLKEVRELTYFGFLVMQSQRLDAAEGVLGKKLTPEQGKLLGDLQSSRNKDFTKNLRSMVKRDVSEENRWAFIRQTQDQYMKEYLAISGMTASQFDRMLSGGAALPPDVMPPPRKYDGQEDNQSRPVAPSDK